MEIQIIKISAEERKLVSDFMGEGYPLKIDFNWLMPVVEKIVSLNIKEGKEWYYYTITYCHCRTYANTAFGISWENAIGAASTIEAVWLAVVYFIKWHNQQKTK